MYDHVLSCICTVDEMTEPSIGIVYDASIVNPICAVD